MIGKPGIEKISFFLPQPENRLQDQEKIARLKIRILVINRGNL